MQERGECGGEKEVRKSAAKLREVGGAEGEGSIRSEKREILT